MKKKRKRNGNIRNKRNLFEFINSYYIWKDCRKFRVSFEKIDVFIHIYPLSSNKLTSLRSGSSTSGFSPTFGHHRIGCNVASLFIQASRTIHSLPWNDTTTTTTTTMPHYRNWTTRFHRRWESVYRGADWPLLHLRSTCYLLTKRWDYAFSKAGEQEGEGGDEITNILKVGSRFLPLIREINSWDKEGSDGTGCMYIIACAQWWFKKAGWFRSGFIIFDIHRARPITRTCETAVFFISFGRV